jgi:micrococcal nuclease
MTPAMKRASRGGVVALLATLVSGAGAAEADAIVPAAGTTVSGRVVRVVDGDTVWVRPDGRGVRAFKLRLLGIDAPERCQAGGDESTRALAERVSGRRVAVDIRARDDYKRHLGHVTLDGDDINGWMVTQGWAWSTGWRRDPGPYAEFERRAQAAGLGLHARSGAITPREFRRRHGPCP